MLDLMAATAAFTAVVALSAALLGALTVLPWFVAVGMAQSRQFSTARWGGASWAASAAGLTGAAVLVRSLPTPLALLCLLLCWLAPAALWLTEQGQSRLGGPVGRHQ